MNLDSHFTELRQIRADLKGISPKLSIYAKLKLREKELMKVVGQRELPYNPIPKKQLNET